jgi:hypothetical protein
VSPLGALRNNVRHIAGVLWQRLIGTLFVFTVKFSEEVLYRPR